MEYRFHINRKHALELGLPDAKQRLVPIAPSRVIDQHIDPAEVGLSGRYHL
jgi:hypothetical protein